MTTTAYGYTDTFIANPCNGTTAARIPDPGPRIRRDPIRNALIISENGREFIITDEMLNQMDTTTRQNELLEVQKRDLNLAITETIETVKEVIDTCPECNADEEKYCDRCLILKESIKWGQT